VLYRLDDDPETGVREARPSFDMIYDGAWPGDRIQRAR
jgi:hypothetical protein